MFRSPLYSLLYPGLEPFSKIYCTSIYLTNCVYVSQIIMRIFTFMQCLCMATAAIVPKTEKKPGKVLKTYHDVTDPLNALIKGEISSTDFFAASGFTKSGTETETKLNLYAPDCKTLDSCFDEINTLGEFWSDSLGRDISHDLTMSITFTLYELSDLTKDKDLNVDSIRPDFLLNYLFNIDEGTSCLDFQTVSNTFWSYRTDFANTQYGMGINEDLIKCKPAVELVFGESAWTVVYIKFGKTDGVPEALSLFGHRMRTIRDTARHYVERYAPHYQDRHGFNFSGQTNFYYPTAKAIGDDNHYRLLKTYMDHLEDEKLDGVKIIIRSKLLHAIEDGINTFSKFSLVPYLKFGVEAWYMAPSSVRTISKYFKSIILDNDQWKFWNSNPRNKFDNRINLPPLTTPIEAILDYSYATTNATFKVNRKTIHEALETQQVFNETNSAAPLVLRSIIFNIEVREKGNYSAQIDTAIAQQITSYGVRVGCTFLTDSVIEVVAAAVVQACGEINGSIYILNQPEMDIINHFSYIFQYENNVRKNLESAKKFRALIQKFQPDAEVYLRLPTTEQHISYTAATPYCNDVFPHYNQYFEAIINWAKFNDFPVILKSAVDNPKHWHSYSVGWLSYIRPTFLNGVLEYEPQMKLPPLFVLHSSPKSFNNWTVDPCIRHVVKPEPKTDYFLNKHIGTIFDTRYIRQNESIQSEEYEILLSFISHRFNLVEIILSSNWQEFISACKEFDTDLLNGPQKNYFIDYAHPYSESLLIEELTQPMVFIELLNAIPKKGKCAVQGVHLDFSNYDMNKIISNLDTVEKLLEKGQEPGTNLGILLNSTTCLDVFQLILLRNGSVSHIVNRLSYLVCKERYNLQELDRFDIENILETHLYIKRVFKEFQPNLNIHFRIEVDVSLDEDPTKMTEYVRALSNFKEFGKAYDVSYFIVQAFDEENGRKNGWWTNNNYTSLSNPLTHDEKESSILGRRTWRPEPLVKRPKILRNDQSKMSVTAIVAIVLVVIFVISLITLSVYHYIRFKKLRQFLSPEEVKDFLNGRSKPIDTSVKQGADMCASVDYMKFHEDYDLQLADLCIDEQCLLGTGNFGFVYKGTAKGIPAAIKQPNKNCTKASFKSFLMEIKVHIHIGVHTNVVGFVGAYTKEIHKGTLLIATELCPKGSLEGLLRRKTTVISSHNQNNYVNTLSNAGEEISIEIQELYRFSHEIASAMDYLETKQVVHGDLATRNVLLNENYTCKIGDFGLSRKLYEYQKYVKKSQEPLPWKWMAYESLTKMEFTSKSDVWSYGITLWEIFSLGKIPYGAMNWTLEFSDELVKGLRLAKAEFSSEQIYGKMLECWDLDIETRPKFSELVEFFREIGNANYTILED